MPIDPRRGDRRKAGPVKSEQLLEYDALIDACAIRGWRPLLGYKKKRWVLEIKDNGELIAKGSTGHAAPQGLRVVARKVVVSLERSGELSDGL